MKRATFSLIALLAACSNVHADVKLHGLFSNGAVLQRGARVPVWGTATAGEAVTVSINGKTASTKAGADGKWRVELADLAAGGPYELVVTGNNKVTVKDVLVGDVWLCSGQSNMAYHMGALRNSPYAADIDQANFPQVRQAFVKREPATSPIDDVAITWNAADDAKAVESFTAVGFYFARELHRDLKVPIGIINSSWGGTNAEVWVSAKSQSTVPDFKARMESQIANMETLPGRLAAFPAQIKAWEDANGRSDAGATDAAAWAGVDVDTSGWTKLTKLRTKWRDAGLPNGGVAWVRKVVDVPESGAGKEFRVDLGSLEEVYESTYFNGEKLGESGRDGPEFINRYRGYTVPGKLVRAGKNVLAVRLVSLDGTGNVMQRDGMMLGFRALGVKTVDDSAELKIERSFEPLSKDALASRPKTPKGLAKDTATFLYNGMIHPLAPYAIKGAVWYQGEADAGRAYAYRTQLPLLISDWRSLFAQGDFPFLIQQLPNWKAGDATGTGWAELREAQWLTAKNGKNVFISAALDVGDSNDVHPQNKRDPGTRLAKVALAQVYGQAIDFTGPRFASSEVEGKSIRIRFEHATGLKTRDGKPPASLMIAGEDQKFVPATATIDGDSLVVSSPDVAAPVAVRYAFINDPADANLTNETGLPALPFRTDEWPGSTQPKK
jgi:sialate O-acetylesterase